MSHLYQTWLVDKGSLTTRLQQQYEDFSVNSLVVHYAKSMLGEANQLQLKISERALIRDVLLMGDTKPVVFAHSVLPRLSLKASWHGLGKLGNKPLGATLFANPKVKRAPLMYKKLSTNHKLYHLASQNLQTKPSFLWARRSVFSLNCANILVTEVFLPNLLFKSSLMK